MIYTTDRTSPFIAQTIQSIGSQLLAFGASHGVTGNVGYRALRPTDSALQSVSLNNFASPSSLSTTTPNYGFTIAPSTTATLSFQVAQGYALAFIGWLVDGAVGGTGDLGTNGFLQVQVGKVVRQEVPAHAVQNTVEKRVYELDQVVFVSQGSSVSLAINNASASTASITVWPIALIAGTKSNLQME